MPRVAPKTGALAKNVKSQSSQKSGGKASHPKPVPTPQTAAAQPAPTPTPTPTDAARVEQKRLAASDHVNASSVGGELNGYRVNTQPGDMNLTALGTVDWAHWAKDGPASFNHKAGVAQQISNFTPIGTATTSWFLGNGTTSSWSDGTPITSALNVDKGLRITGVGNGYEINVPADTNLRTLKIHLGVWYGQGKFEATLSDGSAAPFIDTSLVAQSAKNATYTISYNAASAGQNLKIKWTLLNDTNAPEGSVVLMAATLVNGADSNAAPVVGISSPEDGSVLDRAGDITLKANAFDTDGQISQVKFYADGSLLGAGALTGTDEYSFVWNDVFAGSYTLTAVVIDDQGKPATSAPVDIIIPNSTGGGLAGHLSAPPTPSAVNLSSEGTLDWAHWGMNSHTAFDHKSGVTQQISNVKIIGANSQSWYNDNATSFSWTNGTPTASASNTTSGIFVSGDIDNGFEITAPADQNVRTLRLYTGLWSAQAKLEASLSDGSAPVFVNTSLGNNNASSNGVFTITYKAASEGQALRLRYTISNNYFLPFGNVTLAAATLVDGGDFNVAPSVSLTGPSDGTMHVAGSNITLNANASDTDGTISKVEFFAGGVKVGEDINSPYSVVWNSLAGGAYTLTAVATDDDGASSTSAPIAIQVNAPPVTKAGADQSITLTDAASLLGSITDDNVPSPPNWTSASWSKVTGPGTVTFANQNAATTSASFSSEGLYVLRLTGSDGAQSSFDDVTVGVNSVATLKFSPTADAHVRDGASATTNFGAATTLESKTGGVVGENRDAYFKFDLANAGDISNAKLRVYAALSAAGSVNASVYPVADTTWTETALNWNNRPALGATVLDTKTVNGTTLALYEFDVTNYLAAEKRAGRNLVTLALHNPSASTPFVRFNSREAATSKPELHIKTPEASFVTAYSAGTSRNNFTGFVGTKITVESSPLTITSLGRVFVSGNTGTHTVKIVKASDGLDVAGASVAINMGTGVAVNNFKYETLAVPVTLAANTAYYIVSQETSGGDQWHDFGTVLTTTTAAKVNNAIQRSGTSWVAAGTLNNSYVPVNFKYALKMPSPSATYRLHQEASATGGLNQLKTTAPDSAVAILQTADLKGQANGEKLVKEFDTQAGTPDAAGYIPAGASATFTLWMKNTGTVGTMFPRAKLNLNNSTGTNICTATGTSALTATLTKYVLTCTVSADTLMSSSDRFHLWVGVNLTVGSGNKSFKAELDIEGTANGNYDSQINVPLPLTPSIYGLSPTVGPVGTSITVAGVNFGFPQGTSTLTFNGTPAVATSWGDTSIVAQVPPGAVSGAVVVTVRGIASNGFNFTVGPADSDGDGLADSWELQYFGNLNQGAAGDPDGDGVSNLQEYLQGRNPTKGAILDVNGLVNLKVLTPLTR